jgi:hypothetical protein
VLLNLLLACAPEPVAFCQDGPRLRYKQGFEEGLTVWPDEHWAAEDSSSSTGLRLELDRDHPALADYPDNYADWFDFLSTLDGFGLTSGLFFRFDDPLDAAHLEDAFLVALTPEGPLEVPFDARLIDLDTTLLMEPRRALPSGTRVVAGLRTDPTQADCAGPSSYLAELLDPLGRQVEHPLTGRYQEALSELQLAPDQVAAMTVFTTQSAHDQSIQVAEIVQGMHPELILEGCEDRGTWRRCEATFEAADFRGEDRVVPPGGVDIHDTYTLPVSVWAPTTEGPFPVVVCGHGLGGDREQCDAIVDEVIDQGVAIVAIDAIEHGDHPTRSEAELELIEPLMIFALRVSPPGLHGLRMRDNFRQSAWDKLQLIQALGGGLDLDGDGTSDLDGARVAYAGVSLGAIMGPEPLALSADLRGGLMIVGGGRITQIIQDSPTFGVLIDLMKPSSMGDGDVDRAFPLLQTMADPADPMIWAPYVQQDRWIAGDAPDVYIAAALDDEVVPNSTNALFAQAFSPPGVGREVWPVADITFHAGSVSGNGPEGASLGFVQFETVTEGGIERPAQHDNVHDSDQGLQAIEAFFGPILLDDLPGLILDPAP